MGLIGACFYRVGEKEVTNGSDWSTFLPGWEKKRSPMGGWSSFSPGAAKKRSPMGLIGTRFYRVGEKEVTNGSDWNPFLPGGRKRGHQWV
jgi:hypothetical protein